MKINTTATDKLNTAETPDINHEIAEINSDNHRPGMVQEGYLVRYDLSETMGWRRSRTFKTQAEAVFFAQGLQTGRFCDDEEKAALIAGVSAA